MFKKAISNNSNYTLPIITGIKRYNKKNVDVSVASMLIVNEDGYVITCKHVAENLQMCLEYYNNKDKIDDIMSESLKLKNSELKKYEEKNKLDEKFISSANIVFPFPLVQNTKIDIIYHEILDLAIIHFDKLKFNLKKLPVFKEDKIEIGTSICKLGYAFSQIITPKYDEENNKIDMNNSVVAPLFPYDGIVTRFLNLEVKGHFIGDALIETSTAGLRGQSGGPIFDQNGNIIALQSMNETIPLDINAYLGQDKKNPIPQFINMGVGISSLQIIEFLKKNNIKYYSE